MSGIKRGEDVAGLVQRFVVFILVFVFGLDVKPTLFGKLGDCGRMLQYSFYLASLVACFVLCLFLETLELSLSLVALFC